MSFYDLTKDFVLSAKELFNYRGKRDGTIPSRGGQKDFVPDGSFMQSKALEVFRQERTTVLSEPRVEKQKNLVEGVWDNDQRLVSLKKPGKFWAHMGFTDKRRNWLYPEEALFLMESNALEVSHGGAPVSIQEGYNMFLGHGVSIEEYQVFSHLRRLGYVVLRHESQPIFTPYERQINLDKYISKQSRRDRKSGLPNNKRLRQDVESDEVISSTKVSKLEADDPSAQTTREIHSSKEDGSLITSSGKDFEQSNLSSKNCLDNTSLEGESSATQLDNLSADAERNIKEFSDNSHELDISVDVLEPKWRKLDDTISSRETAKLNCVDRTDIASSNPSCESVCVKDVQMLPESNQNSHQTSARRFYENPWVTCFLDLTKPQPSASNNLCNTTCDPAESTGFSANKADNIPGAENTGENSCVKTLSLPNIASVQTVILESPDLRLLPTNVEIEKKDEFLNFDVEKYRCMNPPPELSRQAQREEEKEKKLQGLQFSYPELMQRQSKVTASSWREYKQKLAEISKVIPIDHLWKGKVTPLIDPGERFTHQGILERLSIIKSADDEALLPDSDCVVDVKITYDVHLPDSKFKKSMPGTPNHRVCICKSSFDLPGLAEILQVQTHFKDKVPLHWAMVDSGEIAFYVFDGASASAFP